MKSLIKSIFSLFLLFSLNICFSADNLSVVLNTDSNTFHAGEAFNLELGNSESILNIKIMFSARVESKVNSGFFNLVSFSADQNIIDDQSTISISIPNNQVSGVYTVNHAFVTFENGDSRIIDFTALNIEVINSTAHPAVGDNQEKSSSEQSQPFSFDFSKPVVVNN